MDAETGASQMYEFEAERGLFRKPAKQVVQVFMDHVIRERQWLHVPSYKIDSAVKKSRKQIVMATGTLLQQKGELPFLVMISPSFGKGAESEGSSLRAAHGG
ncbi:MAG: hypothetical protein KIT18_13235 [Burkholderiales bacterium]|nr:hypothetical protein [Burkholderiales bacterium]